MTAVVALIQTATHPRPFQNSKVSEIQEILTASEESVIPIHYKKILREGGEGADSTFDKHREGRRLELHISEAISQRRRLMRLSDRDYRNKFQSVWLGGNHARATIS